MVFLLEYVCSTTDKKRKKKVFTHRAIERERERERMVIQRYECFRVAWGVFSNKEKEIHLRSGRERKMWKRRKMSHRTSKSK